MSKKKSRQPSKQASTADKTAAKGSAKQSPASDETTIKSAVNAGLLTSEKQTSTATATAKQTSADASAASKPMHFASKPLTRDAAKYERRQAERQQRLLAERRARRNKAITITTIILTIAIIASLTTLYFYNAQHTKAQTTAANAPFTEPIFDTDYQPIDNVYCDQLEGSVMHIHAHISIWINGQQSPLPQGVGIPTNSQSGQATCFYWLHTHDSSGVIHMESPVQETFTLGQFFEVWNGGFASLGFPSQLLLTDGWTIWVNGHPYHGTIDSIPMNAHDLITIAYNSPNVKPDTTYNWNGL